MRITMKEKVKICKMHIEEGLSISHISELYGGYDKTNIKYIINLYKMHGEEPFLSRVRRMYKRDTKLLAIGQVLAGRTIRDVACEHGLANPGVLSDWLKKYREGGEEAIQDTKARANYLLKEDRFKAVVDRKIEAENERLRAEIAYLKKSQSLAQKLEGATVQERVRIVDELRTKYKLSVLLELAGLSSSVFYYTLNANKTRQNKYVELEKEIERLFIKVHKKRCGYHQIYNNLKKNGWIVGKNKVLEIMRAKGFSKPKVIKWRKYNSYEGNLGLKIENIMNQDFKTTRPYEKGGTDVTEFPMFCESVYLSPVIDFHTREVLAYSVGTDAKVYRIIRMLRELQRKHGNNLKGMMLQSDQGVQYQNSRYIVELRNMGIIQSMSRKGNCLDNSPTENFFGRLKQEIWDNNKRDYDSVEALITTIHEYINYYNKTRIIMKTKLTPIECRNNYLLSI